jgi:hypothetical protein
MHPNCSACGLQFEDGPGNLWGFWVFTDRIFLFGAIVVLYLGFTPERWIWRAALFAVVAIPLIATMPHRQGAFVALDYLSRTHWRS